MRLVIIFLGAALAASSASQESHVPDFRSYPAANVLRSVAKPPVLSGIASDDPLMRCVWGVPESFQNQPVNFAGGYVLRSCTCGSGCFFLYMWDARSGRLYYPEFPLGAIDTGPFGAPPASLVYNGEDFRADSRLLVIQGCREGTCDCATWYFEWTGSRFRRITKRPVKLPLNCSGSAVRSHR